MKFIFMYDLKTGTPHPNEYFLAAAQLEGMLFVIRSGEYMARLPHSTLWGEFLNLSEATRAFNRALGLTSSVVGYGVMLEKRAITSAGDIATVSDDKVRRDPDYTAGSGFNTALLHQQHEPLFALPTSVLRSVRLARRLRVRQSR